MITAHTKKKSFSLATCVLRDIRGCSSTARALHFYPSTHPTMHLSWGLSNIKHRKGLSICEKRHIGVLIAGVLITKCSWNVQLAKKKKVPMRPLLTQWVESYRPSPRSLNLWSFQVSCRWWTVRSRLSVKGAADLLRLVPQTFWSWLEICSAEVSLWLIEALSCLFVVS